MNRKEMYEAKERYVEKLMSDNSEVGTLSEEQHEVLRELCRLRHEIHMNHESIFHNNDNGLTDRFNDFAEENDLPFKIDYDELVTSLDYDLLTKEEQSDYEERANDFNIIKSDSALSHSGFSLWCEENFDECSDYLEELNNQIENYLAKIDKEHGTHYCPTGNARLKV